MAVILVILLSVVSKSQPQIDPKDLKELPTPSAIIPLSLDKQVLKITPKVAAADAPRVLCDIGISEELTRRMSLPNRSTAMVIRGGQPILPPDPQPTGKFAILASSLHPGEDCQISFVHGVANSDIGLVIKVAKHADSISCDIRPMFSLPSGTESAFTIEKGVQLAKSIDRAIARIEDGNRAVGGMQQQLSAAKANYRDAANSNHPSAGTRMSLANASAKRLQNQIAKIQSEQTQLPILKKDQVVLVNIGKYAELIAPTAHIYVRFHLNGDTIPAALGK